MNIFLKHFWLNISWRHNVCSCGVNCWGGAEENWPPVCYYDDVLHIHPHILWLSLWMSLVYLWYVWSFDYFCQENWPPVWHYDDVLHKHTSLHHYIWMSVLHLWFVWLYEYFFRKKLTTSGTMMTTHIKIFCISMHMTLSIFVHLCYVCLCDFFCQGMWPQPP